MNYLPNVGNCTINLLCLNLFFTHQLRYPTALRSCEYGHVWMGREGMPHWLSVKCLMAFNQLIVDDIGGRYVVGEPNSIV